jgi:competence protein ComEA
MEPPAPTPWRVLETPSADASESSGQSNARTPAAAEARSILPRVLIIGAVALACAIGAILLAMGGGGGSVEIDGGTRIDTARSAVPGTSDLTAGVAPGGDLVVEIVGAVRQPGVYRLPQGSRAGDLLAAAGGYGPRVDTAVAEQALNLAAPLHDGERIRVPSRDDGSVAGPATGGSGPSAPSDLVDLNHATQAELEALPGIGPATAEKIIAAREEAPFAAVEELRSRGILGEKTFEKLRDLVRVG